ncbi:sensor histidine kinase [Streptomyces spectabilis]|uniref:histidine kinase n=1 Tax=Streptomyces spectabilis TaxID=68270 RepID=A0A5P2X883_STRST|nr:histidine kinase [Streptomyces spectabilis]MBB5103422.1 signal transduction histidine kinase [Streptomyces spectabilis]MCI3902612.1 histidine kinase [Streptomyces spectabilis]QEV59934.1 sensor histidine kinase [Streptomyces spectabilis]GGV49056.1 two-component sensor histidine kinase [Streptomyces spectabilis]
MDTATADPCPPEGGSADVPYLPSASRPWWPFSGAAPGTRRALRDDALFALFLAVGDVVLGFVAADGSRSLDLLGWTLLLAAHVPLVWRRRHPMPVLLATIALVAPYHAVDYPHTTAIPVGMVALYTVAVSGRPRRALVTGLVVVGITLVVNASIGPKQVEEILRISGWIVAVLLFGTYVRVHRQYIASVVERAERAERTREEEARRRVAEERLRVARDLHDLLAHSITLVGVQTSVAAHVLAADPERLDRAAIAGALDDIADTCRAARGELRATLEVLRSGPESGDAADEYRGPLPGIDGIGDLAGAARTAGAEVELALAEVAAVPPVVGAAAYRIVQEALTNAVRHGGPGLAVRVAMGERDGTLRVSVTDDGTGAAAPPAARAAPGFGIIGMRERARSVGGTLEAGPRDGRGFEVVAELPLVTRESTAAGEVAGR